MDRRIFKSIITIAIRNFRITTRSSPDNSDLACTMLSTFLDKLCDDDADIQHAVVATTASIANYSTAAVNSIPVQYGGRETDTRNINRARWSWFDNYLAPQPVYSSRHFREVFRIPLPLYRILHNAIVEYEPRMKQKTNGWGLRWHKTHQKF